MKQIFTKILSILMAFVVLLSTMSFTINEHYCGDFLVDSALFSKAESCGMEMENPSPNRDCSVEKSNCCKDVFTQFNGQNELNSDLSSLTFNQQVFVASFIDSYLNLFEGFEKDSNPFKEYSPPFIVKDIQVLDEVYLI